MTTPHTSHERSVHTPVEGGARLHARFIGDSAPTTVLVHGWAVSGQVWCEVPPRWTQGRLVIPDLRGTGQSDSAPTRDDYSVARHGADLIALIEALDTERVQLVGHSMGGLICQWVALERPDLLSSLTLVSPTPASGVPLSPEEVAWFEALYDQPDQLIGMMLHAPLSPPLMEGCVADVTQTHREAFLGGFAAWRTADFANRLPSMKVPTVVLGGEHETPLTPELLQEAVVAPIPGARFVLLQGVGHYPQLEAPDAFVAHLEQALVA